MDTFYVLFLSASPQASTIRSACSTEHLARNPLRNMSEVASIDGLQRLIKVANTTQEWLNAQAWTLSCLNIWNEDIPAHKAARLIWANTLNP